MQIDQHKTFSLRQKLIKSIKKLDVFGIPVSLTYKNDPCIKSFAGGMATLIMRSADIFDMAFKVEYNLLNTEPEVQKNLDQYAYIQLTQNNYFWEDVKGRSTQIRIRNRLETGKCEYGRLGLTRDSIDYLNIIKTYECPLNFKFQLQDINDFSENPIKNSLKPYFLTPSYNTSHSYLFLLSENEVKLQDSMLYGNEVRKKYIETRLDYLNVQEIQAEGGFIQKTVYFTSLVKSLYLYQSQEKTKDGSNQPKNILTRLQRIMQQLTSRQKLHYSLVDVFQACLKRKRLMTRFNTHQYAREKLYQNGIKKIRQELDIRHIVKELRNIRFIQKVLLDKYQRSMIKYFKGNLLNEAPDLNNKFTQDNVMIYLKQILSKEKQNSFDKRLMKSIEISQQENNQFQEVFMIDHSQKYQNKINESLIRKKSNIPVKKISPSPLELKKNKLRKLGSNISQNSSQISIIQDNQCSLNQSQIHLTNEPMRKRTDQDLQNSLQISEISEYFNTNYDNYAQQMESFDNQSYLQLSKIQNDKENL
ncbi:UNKNOWN [Stylonychia lemnae]|uniref:Uncharacterized protein n=1 Tax=Stylonychia lemnae TaxID=5949 RepID=A0A078B693_STYLE|nr:UNKNOWN [Stylonychia lemnae]|eukprot:CDW89063.1 UNKNOWN [Stylonychia lemnae]